MEGSRNVCFGREVISLKRMKKRKITVLAGVILCVIVYNGHVLQTTETYDESIRPCILKLKEENQEKLKSGEATQRRVAIP